MLVKRIKDTSGKIKAKLYCSYEDMLHKLPTLSGLKGNFDCILKEILSRQFELQIHHHYQIPQFLPSIFQESTFISV